MKKLAIALVWYALLAAPVIAADFEGMARVMDADKIVVGDQRIKLYGVEGIERPQGCRLNGRIWDCYAVSVRQLEIIVANEPVQCDQVGDRDPYLRVFGRCMIGGNDLSEILIRAGWGMARRKQTDDYNAAEDAAMAEKVGLWQSSFTPPWDWRDDQGIFVDDP